MQAVLADLSRHEKLGVAAITKTQARGVMGLLLNEFAEKWKLKEEHQADWVETMQKRFRNLMHCCETADRKGSGWPTAPVVAAAPAAPAPAAPAPAAAPPVAAAAPHVVAADEVAVYTYGWDHGTHLGYRAKHGRNRELSMPPLLDDLVDKSDEEKVVVKFLDGSSHDIPDMTMGQYRQLQASSRAGGMATEGPLMEGQQRLITQNPKHLKPT